MYPIDRVYCTLYLFSVYLLRIVLFSFTAPLLLLLTRIRMWLFPRFTHNAHHVAVV